MGTTESIIGSDPSDSKQLSTDQEIDELQTQVNEKTEQLNQFKLLYEVDVEARLALLKKMKEIIENLQDISKTKMEEYEKLYSDNAELFETEKKQPHHLTLKEKLQNNVHIDIREQEQVIKCLELKLAFLQNKSMEDRKLLELEQKETFENFIADLEQKIAALEPELYSISDEKEHYNQDYQNLDEKYKALVSQLQNRQNELNNFNDKCEKYDAKISNITDEIHKLKKEQELFINTNKKLRLAIQDLKLQLKQK